MTQATAPSKHYTYKDRRRAKDRRYELIDGVFYFLPSPPLLIHQEVVGEIYRQLATALERRPCRPLLSPIDLLLPKGEEPDDEVDTVVQPDLMVVCHPEKLTLRGVRGAPEFIVEVVSPSSALHDHQRKRDVYERAGVKEYWIVDPLERLVYVYRLEGEGAYGKPAIHPMKGELQVDSLVKVGVGWDPVEERLAAYLPKLDELLRW